MQIYSGKASTSISPSSGDTRTTAQILKEEAMDFANQLDLETGLSRLLRGTDQFYVILVADSGYNFWPHAMGKSYFSAFENNKDK